MSSKILVVNGHPDSLSFCAALTEAYAEGASKGGAAEVRAIHIGRLSFQPSLAYGYRQRIELEEDLLQAQDSIRWADHLVFVYPTWWGTMPALLKGFFDRVLLPGFAYKYRENSPLWDRLLTGKSAQLIVTSDTPSWFNRLVYRQAGHHVMKKNILHFCGIRPVRLTEIGPVRGATPERRAHWLERARQLGERQARAR